MNEAPPIATTDASETLPDVGCHLIEPDLDWPAWQAAQRARSDSAPRQDAPGRARSAKERGPDPREENDTMVAKKIVRKKTAKKITRKTTTPRLGKKTVKRATKKVATKRTRKAATPPVV